MFYKKTSVLITRPKPQAIKLAAALHELNFKTIVFPTLELVPLPTPEHLQQIIHNISDFDWLIFVSPNTVQFFLDINRSSTAKTLNFSNSKVAAIGQGTAKELEKAGFQDVLFPNIANSPHLLKVPALQNVNTQKILIFAGVDGNDLLARALRQRGAHVTMAYTHQSICPNYQKTALEWQPRDISITISTSLASLQNLRTILERCAYLELLKKPLLVISPLMLIAARELGFTAKIIEANGAADEAIIKALRAWRKYGNRNETKN
jgi:uroporphyrinogen-III synthase